MRRMSGISVVTLIGLIGSASAAAQQNVTAQHEAALKVIRETAAEICVTVEQKGQKSNAQLTGEVQARVAGVVTRLADLGVKGSGQIGSEEYQGVSQEALGTALSDIRMCRRHVFDKLVDKLLPSQGSMIMLPPNSKQADYGSSSSAPLTEAGSIMPLPPPDKARAYESTQRVGGGRWNISLYQCMKSHENIVCYLLINQNTKGVSEYKVANFISIVLGKPKLIDEFSIEHRLIQGYYINGRNQKQEVATLTQDERIWLALEFEGAAAGITKGRIILGRGQHLQASIK